MNFQFLIVNHYTYTHTHTSHCNLHLVQAWVRLEGAEHGREASLRKELMRQEKLEQLADKFTRKAGLREAWLVDMNSFLGELDKGESVHAVDAALKRHEAISADIQAGVSVCVCVCACVLQDRCTADAPPPQETRIKMVRGISQELTNERYHKARPIAERCAVIDRKWAELQMKLDELRGTLSRYHDLMSVFSEMEDCLADMKQLEVCAYIHVARTLS